MEQPLVRVTLVLSLVASGWCGHYPQYIQHFQFSNCIGEPTSFIGPVEDFAAIGDSGWNPNGSATFKGMWRYTQRNEDGTIVNVALLMFHHSIIRGCFGMSVDLQPKSAINLVPGDLDDSTLALFSKVDFEGETTLVGASEDDVVFDPPLTVRSWAFAGAKNFTLFRANDFTGVSLCLAISDPATVERGHGITSVNDYLFQAGSAKRGCQSDASLTTASLAKIRFGDKAPKSFVVDGEGKRIEGVLREMPQETIAA